VRQLFRVIDWLLALPPELAQSFHEELHAWEQENVMGVPYIDSIERIGMEKGSSANLMKMPRRILQLEYS